VIERRTRRFVRLTESVYTELREVIVKRGEEYCVTSRDGSRDFGCFSSRELAQERLGQVEFFKRESFDVDIAFRVSEAIMKEQARDPAAVCGNIWATGTEEERAAFAGGTEGRSKDEQPPQAWFDD